MNTKTEDYRLTIQRRMCDQLRTLSGRGVARRDLNHLLVRTSNAWLLETHLNRSLWTRIYKTRVFIYNIETRRAVVELGVISSPTDRTDSNGDTLFTGFELYLMGGIYNKRVFDDLFDYTHPISNQRSVPHANYQAK